MPFWKGSTPEQDAKVDRCVQQQLATGADKSSAYAICVHAVRYARKSPRPSTKKGK